MNIVVAVEGAQMGKIKIGIIGVGNCASALIQGIQFYGKIEKEEDAVGLKHLYLGGYHPRDIEVVCAFDVEASKVGKDLSEAIFARPNNTMKVVDVPKLGVEVLTQRRVGGLLNELSMLGVINTQIANLGRYGRTKRIRINVPVKTLEKVFFEDPRLAELLLQKRLL